MQGEGTAVNYYNEHDPKAAHWLRCLIAAQLIPDGHVDERSICDVKGDELRGYLQVHLFAGIGGWPYALALAGWPADAPVWTGSCPCQPFSSAGKRRGAADERHLWPEMYRLVQECQPATVFGEQVAGSDGLKWFAGVRADLEQSEYAVGCADLPAASVGSPHKRQRLFWVADADRERQRETRRRVEGCQSRGRVADSRLADTQGSGSRGRTGTSGQDGPEAANDSSMGDTGGVGRNEGWRDDWERVGNVLGQERTTCSLGDTSGTRLEVGSGVGRVQRGAGCAFAREAVELPGDAGGVEYAASHGRGGERLAVGWSAETACPSWSDAILIPCSDGKTRRIEPGLEPLVNGLSGRVAFLCGLGNAIVPQVAARFIQAYLATISDS